MQSGFLQHIIGNRSRQNLVGMWVKPVSEVVMEVSGMHYVVIYIGHRKGAVYQWLVLQPIFEV